MEYGLHDELFRRISCFGLVYPTPGNPDRVLTAPVGF